MPRTRGRENALSGDHYCCHKGTAKEGEGGEDRDSESRRPSIAGAEVIYRHCLADRYQARIIATPYIIGELLLLFILFIIFISIIVGKYWHELVAGS